MPRLGVPLAWSPVGFDVTTAAVVFGLIFLVELPDKTFIATLVMATRFRPLLVWIGVSLAFLVQTAVAVTAGGLLARLPRTPVEIFAGLMFLVGGILLIRGAAAADGADTDVWAFSRPNNGVRRWNGSAH